MLLKSGNRYNNHYLALFSIADGEIAKVYEYVDTLQSYEMLKGVLF